jgi:hypothetical protein
MKELDLVYVLGSGSIWKNNELRFSLRSVEANLKGVRNIYIIGEHPGFISDAVIHIYHPDPLTRNADGNMALKILRACQENNLSDDFLFMNDDFIINKPIVASEIPWLHKGDMCDRTDKFWKGDFYRFRLRRTFDVLKDRGYPTIQYDYHAPMLMNKHEFPRVMENFDFKEDIGYTFRSLYGNFLQLPAIPLGNMKKTIYKFLNTHQLHDISREPVFIGYNDKGLNNSFKLWLHKRFPKRSKYEKHEIKDSVMEIQEWLKGDTKDFAEGLRLFVKHSPNLMLSQRINLRETAYLKSQLICKLQKLIDG